MIRAFSAGTRPLHRFTASLILDIPADHVTKERMIAKVLNIGLIYGMGARELAALCRITSFMGYSLRWERPWSPDRRFFAAYSRLAGVSWKKGWSTSPMALVRTLSGRIRSWPEGREPKLTELPEYACSGVSCRRHEARAGAAPRGVGRH